MKSAAQTFDTATPVHMAQAPNAALGPDMNVRLGGANDAQEHEADTVAERIVSGATILVGATDPRAQSRHAPTETIQRKPEIIQRDADGMEEEETVQAKAASSGLKAAGTRAAAAAVSCGGQPLSTSERNFFEPRFGRDLAHVRLHTGSGAAQAARGIGARAYTLRNHIAFGAGQYQPSSHEGRRLIAHELTHTLQQGAVIRRDQGVGQPISSGGAVTPATPDQRREFAQDATRFLEIQQMAFMSQTTRNLEDLLDLLKPAAENGLQSIDGLDADAEDTALREAYRNAVDALIVQRAGSAQAGTSGSRMALYHRHRTHILPWAIPRAEAATNATALTDELIEPLPDRPTTDQRARHRAVTAARARLKVQTGGMNFPVSNWFGNVTALPANMRVQMAGNVPSTLHTGLQNIALQGADQDFFPVDTTIIVLLDLTSRGGGNSLYRFSHLGLGTLGAEIWVERVGEVAREQMTEDEREAMQVRYDGFSFSKRGSWRQSDWDEVLIGLAQIPDHHLSTLGTLKFARISASTVDPSRSGEYDTATHELRVFNPAYASSLTRMGTGGDPISAAAATVVHEIGHALDLDDLRTTNNALNATVGPANATRDAFNEANAELMNEFGIGNNRYSPPAEGDPNRERFEELKQAADDALAANRAAVAANREARTAQQAARGLSGAQWGTSGLVDGAARTPAFRAAAIRDGGNPTSEAGFPTTYPNPDSYWQEYFAESFLLYQSAPELLARTRPSVFIYMQNQFPAQPAQATP